MPYEIGQIIEGKGAPVCLAADDTVARALSLMIEYDYSQLPVIQTIDDVEVPEGMITYEGILRGIRNFDARIADLKVRDVMIIPPIYTVEDDLFDILDRLKDTNAVLVTDSFGSRLVGIMTTYDMTQYFRDRTEDLMRVEDIELMVRDVIKAAYTNNGELDAGALGAAVSKVTSNANRGPAEHERQKTFEDLSLGEYNGIVLMKDTWHRFEPIFGIQRDFVLELLEGVRKIRNVLAHFRADITAEQRDRLKFGAEWLSRRQEGYQAQLERDRLRKAQEILRNAEVRPMVFPTLEMVGAPLFNMVAEPQTTAYSVTESATSGGRLSALADWLQSQPGSVDDVTLTFGEIEEIIHAELPTSARGHRAWWSNDTVGHSQSQQWLAAGWRTTYINLSEGRVTFSRIREREGAYITFFSQLLDDLRKAAKMPVREVSPDGVSWIVIQTLPRRGGQNGVFGFSFTRDNRMRVELYLDLGDQKQTKAAFDSLLAQKDQIEAQAGSIEWERLNTRRASRLAQYHDGQITDEANHPELRKWAVETMIKFYGALAEPAEKAILEAKQG